MFLDEIGARLVAQNQGRLGFTIFFGSMPAMPTDYGPYISVAETGGTGAMRTQNNTATQRPTAQVVVRAKDYVVARLKAEEVYNALGGANGLYNFTLNGVKYKSLTPRTEPIDTGFDENNRLMISFNIDAERQPS